MTPTVFTATGLGILCLTIDFNQELAANDALQRTGAERCGFMSHWLSNTIGFGECPLPAPVAELVRWANSVFLAENLGNGDEH